MPHGYSSWSDVLKTTADGRSLNDLFNEFTEATAAANQSQSRFVDLLTYRTTQPVVSVVQTLGATDAFEEASEYGEPKSTRFAPQFLNMGAELKQYDARRGMTWRYLADATEAEIQAQVNAVIASDQDLDFNKVMGTVFSNKNRTVIDKTTDTSYTVFSFANGTDGWVPPDYAGTSFAESHSHYRTSGATTLESADLDEIVTDFRLHGYSQENGSTIVLFVNPQEADVIEGFRVASGAKADFIPASGARFYTPDHLVGDQPAASFAGFPVKGAYDEALIISSTRIPAGYLVALASGGSNLPSNPIMFREHPQFRGLTLIPGGRSDYPLVDSYWVHLFGTGVRHRLAGLVVQITDATTYTAPALYSK